MECTGSLKIIELITELFMKGFNLMIECVDIQSLSDRLT
jgi:hypothetical protein